VASSISHQGAQKPLAPAQEQPEAVADSGGAVAAEFWSSPARLRDFVILLPGQWLAHPAHPSRRQHGSSISLGSALSEPEQAAAAPLAL